MPEDLDYAHEAGGKARENGRPLSSCPTYAMGSMGAAWRKAWRDGWQEADKRIAGGKHGR